MQESNFNSAISWQTLFIKEVRRFWRVAFQTVAAPVITTQLYLLIFSHVLQNRVVIFNDISYTMFLIPGLIMMTMQQNAFANSSSSLIQSKITGNLIFVLLAPLSPLSWYTAYVGASIMRGLMVGTGVLLVSLPFSSLHINNPFLVLSFAIISTGLLGTLGLIAGLWADKFDHLSAFQNFLILPMTFLSGVFYSISSLPAFWQSLSHFNPFFYMIDGFRYGFFTQSDVSPWLSLSFVSGAWLSTSILALFLLKRGYKIRH